ncbi:hypothetical protein KI387_010814, partial [Taxus chinensis]
GAVLQVKVNILSSTLTLLPYDYHSLHYCIPRNFSSGAEKLEVLFGDRIQKSPYVFHMREEQHCNFACKILLDAKSAKNFKEKIDDKSHVNMILDTLPVARPRQRACGSQSVGYEHGFSVGFKASYARNSEESYFIYNHLSFEVKFHKDRETDSAQIVGFEVTPFSMKHSSEPWMEGQGTAKTCNPSTQKCVSGLDAYQEVEEGKEIMFTYDVVFTETNAKWASRWATYLPMRDDHIHWFSIIDPLMVVLMLSGMVVMILMKTLFSKYNLGETDEEAQEETGWKVLHGDIFKTPANSFLLCIYVGSGAQLFGMTIGKMLFAMLGFLSPSSVGGLMTAMVFLWVSMGLFVGYSSAWLYKMFNGTDWKTNAIKTAFTIPGIAFAIFFSLNALMWGVESSGAVPFGYMFTLVFLWFGTFVPLVFTGGYFGCKKLAIDNPVETKKVPEQAWYMWPVSSIAIGGILPFGVVFTEFFFILNSIWLHRMYDIFGFLFIAFVILMVICAEITIILCYFQLCSDDYYWWWRAYMPSVYSALSLYLYASSHFFAELEITKLFTAFAYFVYPILDFSHRALLEKEN